MPAKIHGLARHIWVEVRAKSRTAALVTLLLLVLSAAATLLIYRFFATSEDLLFAGFKSLALPRSDVPVGAEWRDGIGPTDQGLPESQLAQTRSLERVDLASHGRFALTAEASLQHYLAFGGQESLVRNVKLAKLSIVRIGNLSNLPFRPGTSFIWEAVRVDEFTADTQRGRQSELKANLVGWLSKPNLEVMEKASSENAVTLSVVGADLYVAYRVVTETLEPPATVAEHVAPYTSPESTFQLGPYYKISFESSRPDQSPLSDCTVIMTVTDYKQIVTGSWLTKQKTLQCGEQNDELEFDLGPIPSNDLLQDDIILANGLTLTPSGESAQAAGKFALKRRIMRLVPLSSPTAPGW